jgi:membrane protein DedA with SNARE-associated domain
MIYAIGRLGAARSCLVSLRAGRREMPPARSLLLAFAGSAARNAALIGGGWALGANWERIASLVGPAPTMLAAGLAIVGIAGFIQWRRMRLRDVPYGG